MQTRGLFLYEGKDLRFHRKNLDVCGDVSKCGKNVIGLMTEAAAIANRSGVTFRVRLECRLSGAERLGEHRTSMLQDLDAGRRLELDAVLGSIIELGNLTGIDIPNLKGLYALANLRDRINCQTRGL